MTEEITQATADAVVEQLLSQRLMGIASKEAIPMKLVAVAFDVANPILALLGAGQLPSGERFRRSYFTAIWPFVWAPEGYRERLTPREQLQVFAHEATHGDQQLARPWEAIEYVRVQRIRAAWEAEAFATNDALDFALDGVLPPNRNEFDHPTRAGYALTPSDQEIVKGLREQSATSLLHGLIVPKAARSAIKLLNTIQPRAIHPAARVAIMAGSPGLLA